MNMDKDALLHQPQNPVPIVESWKTKRQMSEQLENQVNEFLRAGGSIQRVDHPTVAQIKTDWNSGVLITREENSKSAQKHKHAHLLNREVARENGHEKFVGMKCIKCGNYERWTKSGACTACKPKSDVVGYQYSRREASKAKAAADAAGLKSYKGGLPCRRCGCDERSVETSACIKCGK